jgi:hypothetical protein
MTDIPFGGTAPLGGNAPPAPPPSETGDKWTAIWRPAIAIFGLAVFGVAFWVTMKADPTTDIAKSFPILVGAIVSLVSTISGYYFGSSVGSNNKDDTIKKILTQRPPEPR